MLFEVAHLRQDFAFYLTKHVKIKKAKRSNTSPTRKRGTRKSSEKSARLRFGLVFVQLQNSRFGLGFAEANQNHVISYDASGLHATAGSR